MKGCGNLYTRIYSQGAVLNFHLSKGGQTMWRCGVCGYVWDGEEPPETCPKCGAARERFAALDDKAVELIDRSRFTNSLHLQLYTLLEQVLDVAEDGVDDNLDPGCVKIFQRAMEQAEILQQSIKAELQTHMNKGKWG